MVTYIHYGSDIYNPSLAFPARNSGLYPEPAEGTGLWASRESSTFEDGSAVYGWEKWCTDCKYKTERLKKSFRFRLLDTARTVMLEKPEDLEALPKTSPWKIKDKSALNDLAPDELPSMEQLHEFYGSNPCYLDYEKMIADGIDAIELRNSHLFSRYLKYWDCDCLVVLNPEVVVPLMEKTDHALMKPVSH